MEKQLTIKTQSPLVRIPKKFLDVLTNSDKRVKKIKVAMSFTENELTIRKIN